MITIGIIATAVFLLWVGLNATIDIWFKRPCMFGIECDDELLTLSVHKRCADCGEWHVMAFREFEFDSPLASEVAGRLASYLMVFTLVPSSWSERWLARLHPDTRELLTAKLLVIGLPLELWAGFFANPYMLAGPAATLLWWAFTGRVAP